VRGRLGVLDRVVGVVDGVDLREDAAIVAEQSGAVAAGVDDLLYVLFDRARLVVEGASVSSTLSASAASSRFGSSAARSSNSASLISAVSESLSMSPRDPRRPRRPRPRRSPRAPAYPRPRPRARDPSRSGLRRQRHRRHRRRRRRSLARSRFRSRKARTSRPSGPLRCRWGHFRSRQWPPRGGSARRRGCCTVPCREAPRRRCCGRGPRPTRPAARTRRSPRRLPARARGG